MGYEHSNWSLSVLGQILAPPVYIFSRKDFGKGFQHSAKDFRPRVFNFSCKEPGTVLCFGSHAFSARASFTSSVGSL